MHTGFRILEETILSSQTNVQLLVDDPSPGGDWESINGSL